MSESSFTSIDRRRFLAALLAGSSGMSWSASARSSVPPHKDPPAATPALAIPKDERVRAIRDALTPQIVEVQARFKIPALSLALVNTDAVLWSQGFGLADVEAGVVATAATRYRAGSMAKPLTAIAVMQLADAGRIDIDQPLSTYLTGFSVRSRFEAAEAPVSVRSLLCHHSGLPTDLAKGMWTDEPFTRVAEVLRDEYAAFPPELVFSYSNLGYSLLGHLVEVVSGQPFVRYMEEHVLGPLRMADTRFVSKPSPQSARGYRDGASIALLPVRDLPAQGIETSVADLSRLMCALLGGGELDGHQILTPTAVEAMSEVQNPDNLLDMEIFNGLGWFLEQDTIPSCGRVLRHGATMPGFAGECLLLPEEGLGIAVLANADGARSIVKRLAEETLSRAMSSAPQPVAAELFLAPAERQPARAPVMALAGDYATDLGLIAFRPDQATLCICITGDTFDLAAFPDGWFGIGPKSVGALPPAFRPLADMQFQAQRRNGREVMIARRGDREMVLGEKAPPLEPSQPWGSRVGAYEILNADPGFPVVDVEIKLREGRLCFRYRMPHLTSAAIQVPLRALSESDAIILGLGRTRGETLRVVRDAEGEERLRFSGLIGRRLDTAGDHEGNA
jgi:CubicO group peptidase (beta-lactamase class C family)